jgi:leader peptidase (prepilin peptidase)/N-methyltransferase
VELLLALLFTACFSCFGMGWLTVKLCIFCFLVVGLIFMDAETNLLPREFTYTGIALGLAFSLFVATDPGATQLLARVYGWNLSESQLAFLNSLLGALVGASFFYLAWALYYLVRKRHGLGFGDIALMAMSGAFLGLKLTVFVLFTAPVLGALYAITLLVRSARPKSAVTPRKTFLQGEFPFGVFLGVSSLVAVFFGDKVWRWYLGFF